MPTTSHCLKEASQLNRRFRLSRRDKCQETPVEPNGKIPDAPEAVSPSSAPLNVG